MAEYKQREAEAEAWERKIERKQLEKAAGLDQLTNEDLLRLQSLGGIKFLLQNS